MLARDQNLLTAPTKYNVGKYGVLITEFEKIALQALQTPASKSCLVVDEIGKMEFFSLPFKNKISEIFSTDNDYIVLATIPIRKSDPLIELIRNNNKSRVWVVTRENRNTLQEEITKEIKSALL
ncbi:unnamed protein product [Leptosia nina]|uniref:Uncharacterized protein n=1 Tax=Leptosia nina TaxID=320188 RepID=A0AAV1JEF9_9NEOP